MRIDDLVPSASEYLSKSDVPEQGRVLTIRGFKRVTVKGDAGDEAKVAMLFDEQDVKPMLLNKTNAARLKIATKVETTEECKGKRITVYHDPFVEFGGRVVGGLRIREAPPVRPEFVSGVGPAKVADFDDEASL